MRYVLDTNMIVAAMKGHPNVVAKLANVEASEVGIPLIVVAELLFGAHRSRRVESNLADISRLRSHFPILPVTEAVVERYASVRAQLAAKGIPKGDFDLLIASTAIENGSILVTNDGSVKDGAIENLVVEDWLGFP